MIDRDKMERDRAIDLAVYQQRLNEALQTDAEIQAFKTGFISGIEDLQFYISLLGQIKNLGTILVNSILDFLAETTTQVQLAELRSQHNTAAEWLTIHIPLELGKVVFKQIAEVAKQQ